MQLATEENLEALTDEVLDELARDTGASSRFLKAARPIILRVFLEIPLERRGRCLDMMRRICTAHAETERHIAQTRAHLSTIRRLLRQWMPAEEIPGPNEIMIRVPKAVRRYDRN